MGLGDIILAPRIATPAIRVAGVVLGVAVGTGRHHVTAEDHIVVGAAAVLAEVLLDQGVLRGKD